MAKFPWKRVTCLTSSSAICRQCSSSHQPEITFGLGNITLNLLSQVFDRAELYFIPHAGQERNLDFSLCGKFQRMKVKKMAFNGKRIAAKRRPIPNVSD